MLIWTSPPDAKGYYQHIRRLHMQKTYLWTFEIPVIPGVRSPESSRPTPLLHQWRMIHIALLEKPRSTWASTSICTDRPALSPRPPLGRHYLLHCHPQDKFVTAMEVFTFPAHLPTSGRPDHKNELILTVLCRQYAYF